MRWVTVPPGGYDHRQKISALGRDFEVVGCTPHGNLRLLELATQREWIGIQVPPEAIIAEVHK